MKTGAYNIKTEKVKILQRCMSRQSLFGQLPDDMVLTILSYGEMEDIQNTRIWQSKKVQHWTETRSNFEASKLNNFENLKWIYGFIGDMSFTQKSEITDSVIINCTGMKRLFLMVNCFIMFYL